MDRRSWEWSRCDLDQCWSEISQIWQSEGFRELLRSHWSVTQLDATAEGQTEPLQLRTLGSWLRTHSRITVGSN